MDQPDLAAEREFILQSIRSGNFRLRDHAVRRSDERELGPDQVRHVAGTLIGHRYQADKFTHWFVGHLDAERTGGFTAVVNEGVWIVTVFRRRRCRP
jgi:hypothetical protein